MDLNNLTENIIRIKSLMNLSEQGEEQLTLFSGNGDPISLNSDVFTKKFKEKVYFILKDLYKSNWDSDKSRGPGGGGGVVNVHTVYDLLQKKGLTDYDPEGGDWSILNYFDTNPQVRKTIVGIYEKETGNILDNTEVMEDFIKWMSKNRYKIFKDGTILNELIQKNIESLYRGELNERKAYDYLSEILKNLEGWKLRGRSVPGSKTDRNGVDFVMINEKTKKEAKFQVKPLDKVERVRNYYKIKSYNIKGLEKKPVDYFIFASDDKNDVFIFRNTKGKYTVLDNNTVQFEEPPIEF
jgi:hypothetical protein